MGVSVEKHSHSSLSLFVLVVVEREGRLTLIGIYYIYRIASRFLSLFCEQMTFGCVEYKEEERF